MTEVEAYLETLAQADADIIRGYYTRALELVPEAIPARKYGMAALAYRDRGLVAIVVRAHGFSLCPFGSAPIERAAWLLGGLPTSSGAVRFTADRLIPPAAFDQMVLDSREGIDARLTRS
ncbi:hypothetical protein Back2_06230 [Nocardioides baekrokdamisoli]|uniref:YdhG-like domain-containing protein n=1 Tax=Nocardioides baekrokdamisoli TaxID=1804624 RepID=A0A3G9ID98_9ACTN|nr:hypothetical protein [Nocardioides baekrokdamisoli]BBH16336.1 hypothetical protein Back2_06230 [Nocardioides baekrokdamisoli]